MRESVGLELLTRVVSEVLTSPNELDRNFEPANMVDGLFAIARALTAISVSLDNIREQLHDES